MAKTRMLKHELRTSLKVASWPIPVRYFWALLWGYLDDSGKGVDSPLLVKADCFPLDPDITGEVVDGWLWILADSGVIVRYTVSGTDYIAAVNWKDHQKPPHPSPDILPAPNASGAILRTMHEPFMQVAGNMHASLTPSLGWVGLGLVGGDANAQEPPSFCNVHANSPTDKPCRACGDARRRHDAWERKAKAIVTPTVSGIQTPDQCKPHGYPTGTCPTCDEAVSA